MALHVAKRRPFVTVALAVLPITIVMYFGLSEVRRSQLEIQKENYNPFYPSDLLPGVYWGIVVVFLRYYGTKLIHPLGYYVLEPRKLNTDRLQRFSTVAFKFIYFAAVTYVGHVFMVDEEWFPAILGGKSQFSDLPLSAVQRPTIYIQYYFLSQLGYHVHSLLYVTFITPARNDMLEMLLHHTVTVILIIGAMLGNSTWNFGCLVAYIHDIGDLTGYAIKTIVDAGNTALTAFFYLILLVSWAYTRLYAYPYLLFFHMVPQMEVLDASMNPQFVNGLLTFHCVLLLMHVYWYTLFLKMGYVLLKTGKGEDIQQKCDDHTDQRELLKSAKLRTGKKVD